MADLYLDPTYARAHNREAVQTIPHVRSVRVAAAIPERSPAYIEIECEGDKIHRVALSVFERLVVT